MAPYLPVTVCRSDGIEQYVINGVMTSNSPKDIGKKPDAKGRVYTKLESSHMKSMQWRRKLGIMMMDTLDGPKLKSEFILKELPEGYVLWEHSADNEEEGAPKDTERRTDTYLYGHPGGRTKRFRSPQEFLPHLLWLAGDRDGDSANCLCKLCASAPKDIVEKMEEQKVHVKETGTSTPTGTEVQVAASRPPPVRAPPRVSRSAEQIFDSEANGPFLYRPGELVWFNKGSAWGLAVICKRRIVKSIPNYLVQPLSHPLRHCSSLIKDQDSMRPWLAWSVPNTTHKSLMGHTYDQVPWDQVLRGELGEGEAEVDGSILAAKAIDSSYTLFDRLDMPTAVQGEMYYNGMFLGAEKVWVGEPVRMRVPSDDIVIMVIQQMIERTAATTSLVTVVGDIYKFVEMPTPYNDRKDWPTPDLPSRMVVDLRFRNEVSDNVRKHIWYEWRLLEPMARKSLSDIKGRWYETRALLPILRGAEFQQEISKGMTSDVGIWMNGRGDSNSGPGQRKKNRQDTLGKAVPPNLKISRGLNGSAVDDLFPDEQSNALIGRSPANDNAKYGAVGVTVEGEGELDQFMNIDHASEYQNFYGNSMQH